MLVFTITLFFATIATAMLVFAITFFFATFRERIFFTFPNFRIALHMVYYKIVKFSTIVMR